ncbi:hypothetical protein [Cohnella sp. GCM10027633]|uniref:hypothetical protein n=1 Tax=unclassified Cohnella TaxID=2636738 RepID=UPI0036319112
MEITNFPSLRAVSDRFVGEVIGGKMKDEQHARSLRISSIQSKLNHSKYHLNRFLQNYSFELLRQEAGQELLRAEFYAYLGALLGSIDLVLHEVNVLYGLEIGERRVNPERVRQALRSTSYIEILRELESLETFEWYKSLKDMRNKATHNPGMIWTVYVGGDKSGTITLPDDPFDQESDSTIEISLYLNKTYEHTVNFIDHVQFVILEELPE